MIHMAILGHAVSQELRNNISIPFRLVRNSKSRDRLMTELGVELSLS